MARYSKADLLALKSVQSQLPSVLHSQIVKLGIFVDDEVQEFGAVETINEIFPLMSLEIKEPQRMTQPTNAFTVRGGSFELRAKSIKI